MRLKASHLIIILVLIFVIYVNCIKKSEPELPQYKIHTVHDFDDGYTVLTGDRNDDDDITGYSDSGSPVESLIDMATYDGAYIPSDPGYGAELFTAAGNVRPDAKRIPEF